MAFSDNVSDEILRIFQVEAEEIIARLGSGFSELDKSPTNLDVLTLLFRDAHSLKGASRMVGFNNIQSIAHKMEDIFGLAKEKKVVLNSKMISILYKSLDFISDLIQRSVPQCRELYSEDIPALLKEIASCEQMAEEISQSSDDSEIDEIQFKENIFSINQSIINSLFHLMKLESAFNIFDLSELSSTINNLTILFSKSGPFELKSKLEDINLKLEIVQKTSSTLNSEELSSFQATIDYIISKLIPLCELHNIPPCDYYSEMFNLSNQSEKKYTHPQPVIDIELKQEVTQSKLNENISYISVSNILNKLNLLVQNEASFNEVVNLLHYFQEQSEDESLKKIVNQIIKILSFMQENSLNLSEDTAEVIQQSLEHCDNIQSNRAEVADNKLVFQRLEIVQKVLEMNQQSYEDNFSVQKSGFKIKTKKISDFSKVFNTGAIKTLRVDSSKLDSLINQVSELTINKIKMQKRLSELLLIKNELDEWHKSSGKFLEYLKHYEKKYLNSDTIDSQMAFLIKQFLSTFSEHNDKVQNTRYNVSSLYRSIQDDDAKMGNVIEGLDTMVKEIRVLPFATVFHLFGRMVRDIAQEKGKDIDLEILGSETTTDKKIIEEIKAPLIHIIRNAIDHGIETPQERIALGKNPKGKIILSVRQSGNKVLIQIIDDGKGLNIQKIKDKALQKGFLGEDELNSMTDEQITNIIFAPGFSTGDEITNISGRGIGLDVVQSKISQLNGKVKVLSEVNKGCCVQIELPTAMSTIKVFLVQAANQIFAVPMDSISVVIKKNDDEILDSKGRKSLVYNDKTIPIASLSYLLNLDDMCICQKKETILILENADQSVALCVDKLIGDQEIIHKKLSAPFYRLKNISGITTLASGDTCLILNVADILATVTNAPKLLGSSGVVREYDNSKFKILLVDDSITTRTMEKNILSKVGYNIEIAENPIEALELMEQSNYDLIISDIEMPQMNGLEFLQIIKNNEKYSEIPVVMLSSLVSLENKKRAIDLGAEKYLMKSEFNQDELQETVSSILHKK